MDARAPGLQDAELVKRMLMPSVEGPKLWSVACKAGKEFEILRVIFNRQLSSARQSANSTIYSAFARGDLKGYIYVEAMNPALVQRALNGVQGVYLTKMNLIPVQEMTYTLNVKEQKLNVRPNDWVRMKRGKYAGDLAQVIRLHESGETVVVRLIPRLGLEDQEEEEGQAKEIKGTKRKQKTRPAQRLFDPDYVRKMDPTKTVLPRPNGYYQIGPDLYKGGFLEKEVRIAYLATEGVNPTLDEISAFANTADNNDEDHMNLAELVAPLLAAKKDRVVDYSLGDHVEVIEGGLKHATGIVRTINDDTALVDILTASSMATGTELPVSSLRKLFHTGDHVRVIHGIYQDETGSVVKVHEGIVTLMVDSGEKEISVFSKDLRDAKDASIGSAVLGGDKKKSATAASNRNIGDLVEKKDKSTVGVIVKMDKDHFHILNLEGKIEQIPPHFVQDARYDQRRAVAADAHHNTIRVHDRVKCRTIPNWEGSILYLHKAHAFVKSNECPAPAGIFVKRGKDLESLSANGAFGGGSGAAMPAMPMRTGGGMGRGRGHLPSTYGFRGGAKDLLMNQNVVITRGQNKGKWGIVKECTDQTIRVEIHSSGKVVSIERDSCSVKTPTGNVPASVFAPLTPSAITMDYGPTFTQSTSTYSSPVVAQNTYTRMPAFAPRTPAYGMGNATPFIPYGGQTPAAWDIGARTPAPASAQEQAGLWAQTPAYPSMGAKTPAYQPNQDNGSW